MIEELPDLVELSLQLPRGLPSLLSHLKNPLPRLRVLKLSGGYPSPEYDLDSTADNSLGSFFRQHPRLCEVSLSWHSYRSEIPPVGVALMLSLFPSVKCFSGPLWVCMGLVASQISTQLEALNVKPAFPLDGDQPVDPISRLAKVASPLPNLKTLAFEKFWPHGSVAQVNETAVGKLLTATPALTSLDMQAFLGPWVSPMFQQLQVFQTPFS